MGRDNKKDTIKKWAVRKKHTWWGSRGQLRGKIWLFGVTAGEKAVGGVTQKGTKSLSDTISKKDISSTKLQ